MSTVQTVLRDTERQLVRSGVGDARLEAELVWMTALDIDRALLYAHLQETPLPAAHQAASELLARRLRREPTAYLMGHREFFGLSFHVAPGVLIPRPETETIVEEALRLAHRPPESDQIGPRGAGPVSVADVGTGSAAIAVSVAASHPEATVYATDISQRALEIAALNVREHGVSERVHLLQGDLLSPLPCAVDLMLANLPYVMSAEIPTLEPEIRLYEPREALDGGEDGLEVVARLLAGAPPHVNPSGSLLLELDPRQMEGAATLALRAFPQGTTRVTPDLAGRARVLVVTLP